MINNIVTYTYDNVGNLSTAANYNGVYTMAYDNDNEMTLVHEPVGATLTMVYDGVGNRTEVDDSFGGTENSTYDALNRLINRSYTYGVTVQAHIEEAYDALNEVTQVKRDGAGSPGTPVSTTNYTYDDAGRITNIHDTIAGSGSNIANYTYTYDAAGNMQTEVLTRTTFTAVTTTYAYDADNQLTGDGTTTVTYDATGNRNNGSYATTTGNELTTDGVWTYTYDNEGNEIGKTLISNGDYWTYGYDNKNELTSAVEKNSGGTLEFSAAYKYDAFGNQIESDETPYSGGGGRQHDDHEIRHGRLGPGPGRDHRQQQVERGGRRHWRFFDNAVFTRRRRRPTLRGASLQRHVVHARLDADRHPRLGAQRHRQLRHRPRRHQLRGVWEHHNQRRTGGDQFRRSRPLCLDRPGTRRADGSAIQPGAVV